MVKMMQSRSQCPRSSPKLILIYPENLFDKSIHETSVPASSEVNTETSVSLGGKPSIKVDHAKEGLEADKPHPRKKYPQWKISTLNKNLSLPRGTIIPRGSS
jgi:hypothetical protein